MKHIVHMDDVHISSYANLVLLQRLYAQMERKRWATSRNDFLKLELENKNKLICFYCNKELKYKSLHRNDQATVDHYKAKSEGGNSFDHNNFVVCCNACNKKKASMDADKFMNSKYLCNKKKY